MIVEDQFFELAMIHERKHAADSWPSSAILFWAQALGFLKTPIYIIKVKKARIMKYYPLIKK